MAVNFSQLTLSGGNNNLSLEFNSTAEIGRKRSFAKVLSLTDKAHPLTSSVLVLKF